MGKLHELLAVESNLKGIKNKIINETIKTFKKDNLFMGFSRSLKMFDDEDSYMNRIDESQEMTTTVCDKLEYMSKSIIKAFDGILQKESTNQNAVADLIVDGVVLAEKVPATYLLGLESEMKELRKVYDAIPTLSPGIKWVLDETKGSNTYSRSTPEESLKTEKRPQHKVIVPPAFPKDGEGGQALPAQIETWKETVNIGKFSKEVWCGMITPTEKSKLIGNVDNLLRAAKQARMRANSTTVEKKRIGEAIFKYINS
ncbi:MAG: hypothetical protein GQ540_03915 [Lutibacter sp.]|uniref:DUF7873 family protein n=1 Tax=Lutibacter sp. TaxID=1925666 RepID=UPI001A0939A8|nr:hypothetical protein [Lutibacter sp.]NOR27660.1 hypothetical protein [Lutibacter sp.]